jgi:hypothetical protein
MVNIKKVENFNVEVTHQFDLPEEEILSVYESIDEFKRISVCDCTAEEYDAYCEFMAKQDYYGFGEKWEKKPEVVYEVEQ